MELFYDKEKTQILNDKIWERWNKDRKHFTEHGFNISEITYCPMKSFCQRTGLKQKPTRQTIGYLVFGIVAQKIIQWLYPKEQTEYKAEVEGGLITGHLDIFEDHEFPLEIKATAKTIRGKSDLPLRWVLQLLNYMSMTNSAKGWIVFMNLWNRQISCYCLKTSSEERLAQLMILMGRVTKLDYAIKNNDYTKLEITPEEYELCGYKRCCHRRQECSKKHKELSKQKKKQKTKKVDVEKTAKCIVCGVPIRPTFKKCYKHAFESVQKGS